MDASFLSPSRVLGPKVGVDSTWINSMVLQEKWPKKGGWCEEGEAKWKTGRKDNCSFLQVRPQSLSLIPNLKNMGSKLSDG